MTVCGVDGWSQSHEPWFSLSRSGWGRWFHFMGIDGDELKDGVDAELFLDAVDVRLSNHKRMSERRCPRNRLRNSFINYIKRVFSGLLEDEVWYNDVLGGGVYWAE